MACAGTWRGQCAVTARLGARPRGGGGQSTVVARYTPTWLGLGLEAVKYTGLEGLVACALGMRRPETLPIHPSHSRHMPKSLREPSGCRYSRRRTCGSFGVIAPGARGPRAARVLASALRRPGPWPYTLTRTAPSPVRGHQVQVPVSALSPTCSEPHLQPQPQPHTKPLHHHSQPHRRLPPQPSTRPPEHTLSVISLNTTRR